jgi:hypothetical protein
LSLDKASKKDLVFLKLQFVSAIMDNDNSLYKKSCVEVERKKIDELKWLLPITVANVRENFG